MFVFLNPLNAGAASCPPDNIVRDEQWTPYYNGDLIDTHFHIPPPLDVSPPRPLLGTTITMKNIVCTLRAEDTSAVFAFYPVFDSYPFQDFLKIPINVKEKYGGLFVPFLMPPGPDDLPPSMSAKKIKPMLAEAPGLFQGYGEIGLYDLESKRNADDYPPDVPLFQKIYSLVRKHQLIVYFHPGDRQADNFANVLAENPDINFIVHGDQIQGDIDALMDAYPNIYYSVDMLYGDQYLLRADGTKREFLDGLADWEPLLEQDLATWQPLIEEHPNRFMWATDRGDAVWTYNKKIGRTLANYGRAFIARLSPDVQKKFAYKNAQRLINKSKKK